MAVTLHTAALGTRLDRLPLSSFHRRLVIALAGMILFEWVETYAFAFIAPALRQQWNLPLSTVALVVGTSQLGAFAGGVLAGYLADRVGRRRTMLACVTLYCVATIGCVLVQGPWQLIAARTATHLGAQGMAVVAIVVLTEFVPAATRGRLQTYKVAIGSLGIPVAAWAGYFLVPAWTWGWRLVFGLGLLGVVFAVLIHRWVPESPRWLASRGRLDEADAIVRHVEAQCGVPPQTGVEPPAGTPPTPSSTTVSTTTGPTSPAAAAPGRPRLSELWTGAHRRNFLIVTTMWVTGLLAYSAYNTWTPTLLAETGLDLDDTLLLSAVLATAAPLGALAAIPLIDRWDRRRTQLVLGTLSATALLLFSLVRAPTAVLVLGCLVSLLFQMAVPFLQVYSAEIFPTRIRALGAGTSNALSRIFNFATPMLVAALYSGAGYTAVFVLIAALSAAGGMVAVRFGPRTTGISLEAATPSSPSPIR
ncbi:MULTISPECIES: MFS transporter [unclassified Streptomyces]|uniref:MFS transporter n=1 Tax=unclassified Streptomyces TaxID=2593676 RepID=UPI0011E84E51|nr:MFS transporter [Streptomyces sp. sk2.1]TXS74057.1 MFS transporter [Streptomyces sp. sk2.1]